MNDSYHERETRRSKSDANELEPYSDPYATLGVSRAASPEAVKEAYFQLVRAHPPEREAETFKQIRAAYERLRTPERRIETDMLLLQEIPVPTDLPAPEFDLTVHYEDLVSAARGLTDLERADFRDEFRRIAVA